MRAAPVVHLELHTGDRHGAGALYSQLLGWRPERIDTESGSYVALELGAGLGGGIVECGTRRALWLPYVEVAEVDRATDRARELGASVLLEEGIESLRPFAPKCQTIDVSALIADAAAAREQLIALGPERMSEFDLANAPRVRFAR